MQFSSILIASILSTVVHATVAESDVQLLTALASDVNSNLKQYIDFFATAKNVPPIILTIAPQIKTYTDNAYTTLLNNPSLDLPALESFASQLPWYSRIIAERSGDASGSGSGSASITSAPSSSGRSSTAAGSSSKAASSASASSSKAGANTFLAPAGAVLGAFVVALM